jgi:hypothetical protein
MNQHLAGSEPGLLGYWDLNEGSGDTAADGTSNGHEMQLGDITGSDTGDPTWVRGIEGLVFPAPPPSPAGAGEG